MKRGESLFHNGIFPTTNRYALSIVCCSNSTCFPCIYVLGSLLKIIEHIME